MNQLHLKYMGIEDTCLLMCESIYCVNTDMERTIKNWLTCLDFKATQLKDQNVLQKLLERPWESFRTDTFVLYITTANYQS